MLCVECAFKTLCVEYTQSIQITAFPRGAWERDRGVNGYKFSLIIGIDVVADAEDVVRVGCCFYIFEHLNACGGYVAWHEIFTKLANAVMM